jgi:UDP-glucuronate 4-epimerase
VIEKNLGLKAKRNLLPMQPGDVIRTCADVSALEGAIGYRPRTSIEAGVSKFIAWYREWRAGMKAAPN